MLFSKIDVNKVEWLNLVFQNRNQSYGAYVLRKESGNYLFRSLMISGFLFSGVILSAILIHNLNTQDQIIPDLPFKQPEIVNVTPLEIVNPKPQNKAATNNEALSVSKPVENLNEVKLSGNIKPTNNPLIDTEMPTVKQIENSIIGTHTNAGENTNNANGSLSSESSGGNGLGSEVDGESIYNINLLEVMPEFPGGMAAWSKFLTRNLRYPEMARDNNIAGRVVVSFIVEKDGQISNLKVLKGIGGGCDEEAMRVIKKSPFWKPGIQNGRAVRVSYVMPIVFRVD